MEAIFKHRQYLSPVERESVATATRLTAQQVRVWFQNRRQKAKQFLSFKHHQNEAEVNTALSPAKSEATISKSCVEFINFILHYYSLLAGNDQIDIEAILAQTQKSTDSQLLQLLFSKKSTKDCVDQNGDANEESKISNDKKGMSDDSAPNNASLGIVSSNGTITITPQALLYLTPLLASANNTQTDSKTQQQEETTDHMDTTSSNNTLNAVQLLQTLSRLQNIPQLQNVTTPNKGVSGPTPLRAQSPVPVEETLITCASDTPTTITTTNNVNNDATVTTNNNNASLSSTGLVTSITSDVLQQILEQASDKSKSWSVTGTPTSALPPALSLSLSSSAGRSARKKRQVFSGQQIAEMEKHFEESPYIDNKEREVLAKEIGLLPDQVKVWFQNRRTKKTRLSWRQSKEAEGQLS